MSRFGSTLPLLLAVSVTAAAQQDGRMAFLSRQLEKSSDSRVRAQAALMLAATKDPKAVPVLCKGLGDNSDVVRVAAAKSIGDLGETSGIECLKKHGNDPVPVARDAVRKSLASLEAIKNRKPEYYVQLQPIADKTTQLSPEMLQLAEERLKAKLAQIGSVFAPPRESKAAASTVIKKKKLKGYSLKVELHPAPANGLKLQVLCFTYPEQSLLGEVNVKASGAQAADLIRALAPKAIEEAAETFDWRS